MIAVFMKAMDAARQHHLLHKPLLPDASVCRDLATMAIDHTRLIYQGRGVEGRFSELQHFSAKQQNLIAKLKTRLAASHAV
jgi:hypothetical protein